MRATLTPHPDFPAPSIAIEAKAERRRTGLRLTYRITGDVPRLRLPPITRPERVDGLWKHTCFEAFVAPHGSDAYYELNLSPSGEWAAYRFESYRYGMGPAPVLPVQTLIIDAALTLRATVDLTRLLDLAGPWRLALTAVIEAIDGSLSYWSVAHPPGKPDFHHRDCLALELPAPQAP